MKGYIYVLSSPTTDKIYVGSTIQPLNERFNMHKSNYTNYSYSYEIIKYGDSRIDLVEEVEYNEIEELLWIEREYIELWGTDCVNKQIPIRTEEEKRERRIRYYRMRREKNRITTGVSTVNH